MENFFGIVYKLTCLDNGKIYVGQTTKTLEERFKRHAKADTAVGNAIRKHGEDRFAKEILTFCATKEELDAKEIFFITALDCKYPNGYNLTDGGDRGWSHVDETHAKISEALSGVSKSPEHVAKVAAANTGKKRSPENRRT